MQHPNATSSPAQYGAPNPGEMQHPNSSPAQYHAHNPGEMQHPNSSSAQYGAHNPSLQMYGATSPTFSQQWQPQQWQPTSPQYFQPCPPPPPYQRHYQTSSSSQPLQSSMGNPLQAEHQYQPLPSSFQHPPSAVRQYQPPSQALLSSIQPPLPAGLAEEDPFNKDPETLVANTSPLPLETVADLPKTRAPSFTDKSDLQLCKSWINISEDPITGTDQRGGEFWKRIAKHFNENKPEEQMERTQTQCQNRWRIIQPICSKFSYHYAFCHRNKPSGATDTEVMENAHARFQEQEKVCFKFRCVWDVLKRLDKFDTQTTGVTITRRTAPTVPTAPKSAPTSTSTGNDGQSGGRPGTGDDGESGGRPGGYKAAKRALGMDDYRGKRMKTNEDFVKASKERNELQKETYEAMIMEKNLNEMSATAREFFELKQKAILEKLRKETME